MNYIAVSQYRKMINYALDEGMKEVIFCGWIMSVPV